MGGKLFLVNFQTFCIILILSLLAAAQVNLRTYQVVICCIIVLKIIFLLRILLGPLSYNVVVMVHYGTRITVVSFITMMTFKIFLKTLFIIDFNRMTAIPEKNVLVCLALVTIFCILAHIAEEMFLRNYLGLDHFGRDCFNMYLAKVVLRFFKGLI